jgi:hypothetical protein
MQEPNAKLANLLMGIFFLVLAAASKCIHAPLAGRH